MSVAGGDIALVDKNDLDASSITPTLNKSLNLQALTGTLKVAGGAITLGTGDLTLTSGAGLTVGDALSAANVSLGAGTGSLSLGADVTATGTLALSGGTVTQTAGAVSATGATSVTATGDITLNQATNDFTGAVTLTGANATISAATALKLGVNKLSGSLTAVADSLDLGSGDIGTSLKANTNGGDMTQTGALTVGTTTTLDAAAGLANITLTQANDFKGAVSTGLAGTVKITDANSLQLTAPETKADLVVQTNGALTLGASKVGGNLDLKTGGGAITQAGALTVTGTSAIAAGAGTVTLNNAANDFTGAVTLVSSGDATVVDSTGLTLGATLVSGNLKVNSGAALVLAASTITGTVDATAAAGGISQSGTLVVGGTSRFDAGSFGSVKLADANNDFKSKVTTVGATTLADVNDLDIAASGVGLHTITAANNLVASVGGAPATFNLKAGGTLDVSGATGQITTNSGGDTTIGTLSTILIPQSLSITSGGAVKQTGAITAAGPVSITAAGSVTLDNPGNDFSGVGVVNSVSINAGAAATVVDANALNLGTVSTKGDFVAQAQDITTSGAITVAAPNGVALLATNTLTLNASVSGQDVILDATSMSGAGKITATNLGLLNGAIPTPGTATSVTTAYSGASLNLSQPSIKVGTATVVTGGHTVSGITTTGDLSLNASAGTITQDAAADLKVGGNASLDAPGNTITLANAGNSFSGTVSLGGGAVDLAVSKALQLGNLAVSGDLTVSSQGALDLGTGSVGGKLDVSSNNSAITQTGPLAVTGTSAVDAGTGTITLTNKANDFTGAVSLTGATSQVAAASTITLGASSTTGDIVVRSAGITVDGDVTAAAPFGVALLSTGAMALNAKVSGQDVILDGTSYSQGAGGAVAATNLGMRNAAVPTANATATNIAYSGTSLTWTQSAVNVGSATVVTPAETVSGITTTGDATLIATTGGITQSAAITVGGTLTLDASATKGDIVIGNPGNSVGTVAALGGNFTINSSKALTLGTLDLVSVDVTSNGALNLGQGKVAGTLKAASNGGRHHRSRAPGGDRSFHHQRWCGCGHPHGGQRLQGRGHGQRRDGQGHRCQ